MSSETFEDRFLGKFNSLSERSEPGDAALTRIERVGLQRLLRETGSKQAALQSIMDRGYPFSREDVTPEDLGETAYEHMCVVAASLNRKRGETAAPDTVESYITKNRFDRWMHFNLIKLDKFGGRLQEEWYSKHDRQPGYENSKDVGYPEGVDTTKIYGVAKPQRYWPAQTIRYLEFIRLGKVNDSTERNKLGLIEGEEYKYKIPWEIFLGVLRDEKTLDGIAAGIAVKTMEILKGNGLTDDQVTRLIVAGYSPGGPMNEHGDIPEVHQIWSGIINRINDNPELSSLKPGLIEAVETKMQAVNESYVFNYDDQLKL